MRERILAAIHPANEHITAIPPPATFDTDSQRRLYTELCQMYGSVPLRPEIIPTVSELPEAWHPMRYHGSQAAAWASQSRIICIAAGRGSGKTELARRRLVMSLPLRTEHEAIYVFAAPTYNQAKRIGWRKILQLIPNWWHAPGSPHYSDLEITTIFGSKILIIGMDQPQRLEGSQYTGIISDEQSDQKPGSFDLSIRPALSAYSGWAWRIGVPKRAGIGAAEWKAVWHKAHRGLLSDHAAFTWRSEEVMTDEEILSAKASLSSEDYQEQYQASWLSAGGAIYSSFSQQNIARCEYDPNLDLIVGCDFNVSPHAWVVAHRRGPRLEIIDELWLRNSNTQQQLDILWQRYGSRHKANWVFYGDATSKARHTSASFSDYATIKNDNRFRAQLRFPRANPALIDRFSATNSRLCDANGNRYIIIDPKCKHLISDYESRSYQKDSRIPDDGEDQGHAADACDYIIHFLWPCKVKKSGGTTPRIYRGTA